MHPGETPAVVFLFLCLRSFYDSTAEYVGLMIASVVETVKRYRLFSPWKLDLRYRMFSTTDLRNRAFLPLQSRR
jgi:hypothetical protein